MKKVTIILTGVILMTIASVSVKAQVTATASTSATIYTPIAITKTVDMNFGNVAVSPTLPGTVVLAPAGTRTLTGGVTLPTVTGTVTSAEFTVAGEGTSTFSILIAPAQITLLNGGNSMIVNNFTSTPTPTGTLVGGTATVNVGGTLNVAAAQAAGLYSNASDLSVTVNYN
jgi:hypothetical protein